MLTMSWAIKLSDMDNFVNEQLYCTQWPHTCEQSEELNTTNLPLDGIFHAKSGPHFYIVPPGPKTYIEIFGPPDNVFQFCWNIWTPLRTKISDIFGPLWNILYPLEFTYNTLCKGWIIYFTWNIWYSNSKST